MLSDELKKIYASNPYDARFYEAVEISHSLFSKVYYLVRDSEAHNWKIEDESIKEFVSYPFNIKLPEVGSAQQDISFVFDNISQEIMRELESAAININESIKLKYRVYIDGDDTPQIPVIELSLTNIVADNFTISAIATRPDLYKRLFPTGNQSRFDSRYKGLYL